MDLHPVEFPKGALFNRVNPQFLDRQQTLILEPVNDCIFSLRCVPFKKANIITNEMNLPIEKELLNFIRVWKILGSAMILISFGMVFFSWPDRWLAWLVFILALLFSFFALRHTRMAGKALYLVKHGQPEDCVVEIRKESGDDRDYFKGTVYRESKDKWDICFTPPLWNVDPILQKRFHARVYFESETEYPLVVVTDGGHLWAERVPKKVN
jgi:hypothetical protein